MFFDITILIVIPAMIFALIAQARVRSAFNRFGETPNSSGMTGAEAAERLMAEAGVSGVAIEMIPGALGDHYDPRERTLRLSEAVYKSRSVSAVGVAAHETGHAIQHSLNYSPLAIRNSFLPAARFGSGLAVPMFILGMFISYLAVMPGLGYLLMQAGIILFSLVVAFQLVTLPVEFNASKRALACLGESRILNGEELAQAGKVLNAAALTYVAAAAVSLTQLLRLLMLSGRRR